jgi:hypothetical protein
MSVSHVPVKVSLWARSQTGEFTASRLASELELSHRSASIYLSRLAVAGEIVRLMKGRYISFRPSVPSMLQRVGLAIAREMPLTDAVLWTTATLAQVLHDLPALSITLVEAAPVDVDAVGEVLIEAGIPAVSRPSKRDIAEVIVRGTRVLVLPSRNRYATTPWKGRLRGAMLEKVLIDTYFLASRKGLPIPPGDIVDGLVSSLERGAVDLRVLRRYAARRHLLAELHSELEG